jgi:prepilin-type N-terminal cleavage/methylation domain-containing protein
MKNQQGFSLIELLIVVAIIAIIAAIAVPSMLSARMAANESGAIQGCRTIGSAEVAYAAVNNQNYADKATLISTGMLDNRFGLTGGFNGYTYASGTAQTGATDFDSTIHAFAAAPSLGDSTGRYTYAIGADQAVRYEAKSTNATAPKCGTSACVAGAAIGSNSAS